jgi:DNA-binding response OmpR family regulator
MPHLLLIEDNQHIQRIYRAKLQVEGFKVTAAENGEQGLASAKACEPDAILLDIMLPKMDGFEVLKHLRADPQLNRIPVFMLSNKAWPDDVQYALSLGAHQFYAKGSSSLRDIVQQIRVECGIKKVTILGSDTVLAGSIASVLQHPKLLCVTHTEMVDAVATVEKGVPDLVILAAAETTGNPFAILQQLKTTPATQSLPVLAIADEGHRLQRADYFVTTAELGDELRFTALQVLGLADDVETPSQSASLAHRA